ncbi:MAG: hypothetical protein PHF56_22690, partial [Desulfuromonadaceae bacterium]|nr:hypothetical protein [Desulfuromonadaceae bacterium]
RFYADKVTELPLLDRGRSAMKTSLAGIQPAYIRIIKRRNTGSGPAYALEFMKRIATCKSGSGNFILLDN